MVTSLLDHELIETTDAKAKELRRVADRMITLGKRGSLHARRQAARVVRDDAIVAKVFGGLAERYRTRPGGYTRVLKSRIRRGDAAPLSIVELVDRGEAAEKPPEKKTEKKTPAKKAAEQKPAAEKKPRARKRAKAEDAEPKKRPRRKKAAG